MNTERTEKFVNAIACDLEEGGFRQVSGTMLRRTLATAVSAALPLLADQQEGQHLTAAKGTLLALGYSWNGFQWEAISPPAELAEQQGVELPPLPRTHYNACGDGSEPLYTAEQMEEYARAALAATGKQQVGEIESADDDWHLRGYAYASKQATTCASCGKHKHTPLRIDAMGGYVCLTCIDQKLGALMNEFGYQSEQVGEVQGYALDTDRVLSLADVHAEESREDGVRLLDRGGLLAFAQDVAAALAARQPGAQTVWVEVRREDDQTFPRVMKQDQAEAFLRTCNVRPIPTIHALYAAPPAQGIDLGQVREAVEMAMEAPIKDRAQRRRLEALLALIDQRDAAPGVG